MTRLLRRMAGRPVGWAAAAAGTALVLSAAGCGSGSGHAAPTTTRPAPIRPATTATTRRTPPTTVWKPASPQSSPDAAASQLVAAWAAADRGSAGRVANPAAVTALFSAPYPGSGLAIPRGCSEGFPPIVCTYGPPGGGPTTAAIYELTATQGATGWYVSSVRVEG